MAMLASAIASTARAQDVAPDSVFGTVLGLSRGVVVAGASVALVTGGEARSDGAGEFSLPCRSSCAGDTLVVSHPDFVSLRLPLGTQGELPARLRILLIPSPIAARSGEPPNTRAR